MFQVHLLSALYVSPPPIPKQRLFDNNITAMVINFSEYLFSVPFRYPNYLVSFNLNLSEVQTSTLKRVGLVGLWILFGVFWKTLRKVVLVFAVIKIGNRLGFVQPPKPRDYTRPNSPPVHHPFDPDSIYPWSNPARTSASKKQEPKPLPSVAPTSVGDFVLVEDAKREEPKLPCSPDIDSSLLRSFVVIEDPESEKKDEEVAPLSHNLSASSSFVMVNPDERPDLPAYNLSSSWVVLPSQRQSSESSPLGPFVLLDSYVGDRSE